MSQIRSVLRQHEQGQLWQSTQMVDAMGRDDRIQPVLTTRIRSLLGLDFSMVPPDEDDEEAVAFAADWEAIWPRFAPISCLARLLQDYIMLGVGLAQVWWQQMPDGTWEPRLSNENPNNLYWDDALYGYRYNTREGVQEIVPGEGKWVLLESGERGYRNGAVRALALLWHIRQLSWLDWARYTERHGQPLLKAKHPADIKEGARTAFWNDVVDLGRETSLLLPQGVGPNDKGFDVEILEAKDGNWEAFERLKGTCDSSIAVYLLGQNLTTEVDVGQGSFAAARVHGAVKQQIMQADERELGDDLYWQAIVPISRLLRQGGGKLAPRPTYETTPPSDLKLEAETQRTASQTVSILNLAGYEIANLEDFGAAYNLQIVKKGDAPPPEDGDPSPEGGQDGDDGGGDDPDDGSEDFGAHDACCGDDHGLAHEPSKRVGIFASEEEGEIDESVEFQLGLATQGAADSGGELLKQILSAIDEAENPEDLRTKILNTYARFDDETMSAVLESVLTLSALNGQLSVLDEVEGG